MGIENRDYVRGSSPSGYGGGYVSYGGGYGSGMPPACKWILIITIAVFILQLVWKTGPSERALAIRFNEKRDTYEALGDPPEVAARKAARDVNEYVRDNPPREVVTDFLKLDAEKVVPGFQVWRLVTYAFCHSRLDVLHIIFNMLALWFFGPTLERMYGTREFTWFYLVAAAAAGLVFMAFEAFLGDFTPMIGASGATMAVLMLFAIHYPRHTILIFGIIPIEARWIVAFYLIFDLYPVLLSFGGDVIGDNVAHAAHLGGLAFGYVYFKFQLRFEKLFSRFRLPDLSAAASKKAISKGNLKLYEPPDNLDETVDQILEKISREGEASLSDREREILKTASRRYKKRS